MWDRAKAIEAIVYLASQINDPTKMKICKMLYFADKLHMSRYGRFITGDFYVAMEHGPVPSKIYDIIRRVERGEENDAFSVPNPRSIAPKRPADLYEFSDTDIECLEEILRDYGNKSAKQLRDMSHGTAWDTVSDFGRIFDNQAKGPKGVPMPLELIVNELPNSAAVRELLEQEGYLPHP